MKPPVAPASPDPGGSGHPPAKPDADINDASTGLPWIYTWRGVYYFVLGSFVLWVVLLTLLSGIFS